MKLPCTNKKNAWRAQPLTPPHLATMKCMSVVAVLALAAVSVEAGCYPEGAPRPATLTYEEKVCFFFSGLRLRSDVDASS